MDELKRLEVKDGTRRVLMDALDGLVEVGGILAEVEQVYKAEGLQKDYEDIHRAVEKVREAFNILFDEL